MSTDAPQPHGFEQAAQDWKHWHEERTATVAGPYGPLSLTGTHWLSDHPEGRIPGVPGQWRQDGDELVLTASAADGLTVDGEPFTGQVRLTADRGPIDGSRVAHGERRLVVLSREGLWAVRDFDPDSPARRAFRAIDATPYDARWAFPAPSARTTVPVRSGSRTPTGSSGVSDSPERSPSRPTARSTRSRSRWSPTARSGRSSPMPPAEAAATASGSCGPRRRPGTAA